MRTTRLSGAEVRYLQKSLGWSGVDFARHMGVDPSTVSKWETDEEPIGATSDRLLRLMVAYGTPAESYSLGELRKIVAESRPVTEVRLAPHSGGWELAQGGVR